MDTAAPGEEILEEGKALTPEADAAQTQEAQAPIPQEEPVTAEAPEEKTPAPRKSRVSPAVWVLGMIALLSAALLIGLLVAGRPYFTADEDPQAILQQHHQQEDVITLPTRAPASPEETEPEEATAPTAEPTIPPEANPYDKYDFQYNRNNYLLCTRQLSFAGIDVSSYQGDIDWEKVAASGIQFAIVRLGYRGYGTGKMVEDEKAIQNLEGARAAGLKVGAYFFSQALDTREVDEEIEFMLDILGDFELDMPIILDWEYISAEARTANMDARTLTDCLVYFCEDMEERGYCPMIYFNWYQSKNLLYLNELERWPFWLALYQDRMTYPYHVEMWQYTCTGKVPGILGDVDINVYMPVVD